MNRGGRSDREPRQSNHDRNKSWRSDCEPGRSDQSRNRGWQSDRLTLRSSSVACFVDLNRLLCGALDFGCTPRGVHDSDRVTHGSSVPALPAALLASPSGCAGATDTASTSAAATGEGRTSGLSGQPHTMTTRVKRGFRIPADNLSLSATSS
jgi:hypothetical protein